jgi:hypothetical protein
MGKLLGKWLFHRELDGEDDIKVDLGCIGYKDGKWNWLFVSSGGLWY